jgi:hypothetical protein
MSDQNAMTPPEDAAGSEVVSRALFGGLDPQRYYDAHKNDGTAMDRAKLAERLGATPAPQTRCRIF